LQGFFQGARSGALSPRLFLSPRQKESLELMKVICACRFCNKAIEFESQYVGSQAACPHCGMETMLFEPEKPPKAPEPEKPERADKIESGLDTIGEFFFFFGILGLGLGLLMFFGIIAINRELSGVAVSGLALAISSMIEGWVLRGLFRGLAEIVRLLRRIANKP
jgi:predicted RNA-binding Zn-ribbon protein involved in translation (DUF1610 family)